MILSCDHFGKILPPLLSIWISVILFQSHENICLDHRLVIPQSRIVQMSHTFRSPGSHGLPPLTMKTIQLRTEWPNFFSTSIYKTHSKSLAPREVVRPTFSVDISPRGGWVPVLFGFSPKGSSRKDARTFASLAPPHSCCSKPALPLTGIASTECSEWQLPLFWG